MMFDPRQGRILDNIETLGAVATKVWTVPANKRWLLINCYAERDANATLILSVTSSGDKNLGFLSTVAAGVSNITFGSIANATAHRFDPILLKAGDKVVLTWGVAQVTPEVSLSVIEYDI